MRRGFFSGRYSLKHQYASKFTLVLLALMICVSILIEYNLRKIITEEVVKRGVADVKYLAALCETPLLLYNYTHLEQIVDETLRQNDLVAVQVLNFQGKVVARQTTLSPPVGQQLDFPPRLAPVKQPGPAVTEGEDAAYGLRYFDIRFPVYIEGSPRQWGEVRIILSKASLEGTLHKIRLILFLVTLAAVVCGIMGASFLAARITTPLSQMLEKIKDINRGEWDTNLDVRSGDEIEELATSFNTMTGLLRDNQQALNEANALLKRQLEELITLKTYNDHILASMTNGLISVNESGMVTTFNPEAERITELSAGEVTGRHYREGFQLNPSFVQLLMNSLENSLKYNNFPIIFHRGSEGGTPITISTTELHDGSGRCVGILCIMEDKQLISHLERQLRQADKLASMGKLSAQVAHDIKNPLVAIKTFSQLMPRRFEDPVFRQKYQDVVPGELERIDKIIGDLLNLARPFNLRRRSVEINELIRKSVLAYHDKFAVQNIDLEMSLTDFPIYLELDPEYIRRAIVNLVINAVEAMTSGGRLLISSNTTFMSVDPDSAGNGGRVSTARIPISGEWVEMAFTDTGPGMESSVLEQLTKPFFTTKPHGTGLGLATTQRIVDEHNGVMLIESQQGLGTTFKIYLPTVGPAMGTAIEKH